MEVEDLRSVVEAHAAARVDGNMAVFASYMTPRAVMMLRATPPASHKRFRRYKIVDVMRDGDCAASLVSFDGAGRSRLRSRWERIDGHWKVVDTGLVGDPGTAPWWRRALRH